MRTDQEQNLILWEGVRSAIQSGSQNPTLWDHPDICQNNHGGNPESVKANRHVDKARNEKIILGAITELSDASSEMAEQHLGWSHQSVSSRFSDLKRKGLIVRAGVCKTQSGCSAAKYRIV